MLNKTDWLLGGLIPEPRGRHNYWQSDNQERLENKKTKYCILKLLWKCCFKSFHAVELQHINTLN